MNVDTPTPAHPTTTKGQTPMPHTNNRSTINPTNDLERVLTSLDELGLTEAVPDVRVMYANALDYSRRSRQAATDYSTLQRDLARGIVDGRLDLDAALDEIADADRKSSREGAGAALLEQAAKIGHNRASKLLADYGDRLITEVLGPLADETLTDAAAAAEVLPDWMTNDEEAMKGDRHQRDAWATLVRAANIWKRVQALTAFFRSGGFMPTSTLAAPQDEARFHYRHPERLSKYDPSRRPPLALILALDIRGGAEPALLTAAEVDASLTAERDAREAAKPRPDRGSAWTPRRDLAQVAREVHADIAAEAAATEPQEAA